MPFLAITPTPTAIAAGVASPKAQGHAITKTATAFSNASSIGLPITKYHMANTIADITRTTGTNQALIRSASL